MADIVDPLLNKAHFNTAPKTKKNDKFLFQQMYRCNPRRNRIL